jgi:AraC family transcriptional regulator
MSDLSNRGAGLALYVPHRAFVERSNNNREPQEDISTMNYKVTTTEVAAQKALVVKGKVKVQQAGEAIGVALGKVGEYLESKGQRPSGAPFTRTFAFENGELDFEAGFPVSGAVSGQGSIIGTELPKATVATTMHVGPQDGSEKAYEAIHAWMGANGKSAAGAPWEVYLTDPSTTPESESQMQVFFPIR